MWKPYIFSVFYKVTKIELKDFVQIFKCSNLSHKEGFVQNVQNTPDLWLSSEDGGVLLTENRSGGFRWFTVKLVASCHNRFLYPWRMPRLPAAPSLRWKLSGIAPSTIHKSSTSIFPPPALIPSSPVSAVFHPSLFILKWQQELHVSLRREQVKREKACQTQSGILGILERCFYDKEQEIYTCLNQVYLFIFTKKTLFLVKMWIFSGLYGRQRMELELMMVYNISQRHYRDITIRDSLIWY